MAFRRPFRLPDAGRSCPPGEYLIVTDEEMLKGRSFAPWRRIATRIHIREGGATHVLKIDPRELVILLGQDAEEASVEMAGGWKESHDPIQI